MARLRATPAIPWRAAALATAAAAILSTALGTGTPIVAQTFRSSVDLIAVDVFVADRSGQLLPGLGPESFEVTLDGRKRRVVSATFTTHEVRELPRPGPPGAEPAPPGPVISSSDRGGARTFIIVVDTGSFRTSDVHVALLAAERFIQRLAPDDQVAIFTLPDGPQLEATTSRASVRRMLNTIVGRKIVAPGQFGMTVEQAIDITATAAVQSSLVNRRTISQMMEEESVSGDSLSCGGNTVACTETAILEAENLTHQLEEEVMRGLAGLDSLLQLLQGWEGRKTVLLLSGGMPVSDRSGGRPRLGTEVKRLGERATYANATIHTLFFDQEINAAYALDTRKPRAASGRTRGIYTRALAEFSEPSGGKLLEVSTGAGESEIDRLLDQMSSYYVLGVQPEERDRDGLPHRLGVKVAGRNVQVRNRQLVIVPKAN